MYWLSGSRAYKQRWPIEVSLAGRILTRTSQCLPSGVVPEAKAFCQSVGAGHFLKVLQKLGVLL